MFAVYLNAITMKTLLFLAIASLSFASCQSKDDDPAPAKQSVTNTVTVRYNGQRLDGMRARVRVSTGIVNDANRTQLFLAEPTSSIAGGQTYTVSNKDYFAATISFAAVNSGNSTRPQANTSLSVEVLVNGVSRGSVVLNQQTVSAMLLHNRFVEATVGVDKW